MGYNSLQTACLYRGVESGLEPPESRFLARSRSLSFEGDSGPYPSHLDFCVILLQSI